MISEERKPGEIWYEPDPQQRGWANSWRVFTQGDSKRPTIEHGLFPDQDLAIQFWDHMQKEKEAHDFTDEEWLDELTALQKIKKADHPATPDHGIQRVK